MQQKWHPACNKSCYSSHERFSFGNLAQLGATAEKSASASKVTTLRCYRNMTVIIIIIIIMIIIIIVPSRSQWNISLRLLVSIQLCLPP